MEEYELLQQKIYDLGTDIEELKKEFLAFKDAIPNNLTRRIDELESKLSEMQDAIDDLENP